MNFERGRDPKEALQIGMTVRAKMVGYSTVYEMPLWLWKLIERYDAVSNELSEYMKQNDLDDKARILYNTSKSLSAEIAKSGEEYGCWKEWFRNSWTLINEITGNYR